MIGIPVKNRGRAKSTHRVKLYDRLRFELSYHHRQPVLQCEAEEDYGNTRSRHVPPEFIYRRIGEASPKAATKEPTAIWRHQDHHQKVDRCALFELIPVFEHNFWIYAESRAIRFRFGSWPCENSDAPRFRQTASKCQPSGTLGPPRVFLRLPSLSNERCARRSIRHWLRIGF
jgi:hypothetical protein